MWNAFELTRQLVDVFGPSGQEGDISQVIADLARPYADDLTTDALGNLIVHRKGDGPRLMLAAHMDTVGLVVTYFEKDGTLRLGKLGGITPMDIRNAPVRFQNGIHGAVKVHGKADESKLTIDDLYLDIGAANREEAQSMVALGDVCVFSAPTVQNRSRVISPYLDNRISCAVLLMALERLRESQYDLYAVFTVQEELGLRGAKPAAYGVDPQLAIALDVTATYDYPGAPKAGSAALGAGAAIKVMDASVICRPELVDKLSSLARAHQIKAQMDVLTRGGTDAGAILPIRHGVITGGISVPCRYSHTPTSVADLVDVESCVQLVTTFIESR